MYWNLVAEHFANKQWNIPDFDVNLLDACAWKTSSMVLFILYINKKCKAKLHLIFYIPIQDIRCNISCTRYFKVIIVDITTLPVPSSSLTPLLDTGACDYFCQITWSHTANSISIIMALPKVFFDISVDGKAAGRITFQVMNEICP